MKTIGEIVDETFERLAETGELRHRRCAFIEPGGRLAEGELVSVALGCSSCGSPNAIVGYGDGDLLCAACNDMRQEAVRRDAARWRAWWALEHILAPLKDLPVRP